MKTTVATACALLALACFGSGGGGSTAGAGATGGTGAAGTGAAGTGAGGTGAVCGVCSVPACAPGESPRTEPGACCPSCGIVGTAGTGTAGVESGGAGGTGSCFGPCAVPTCAPGETLRTEPGACCPSCGIAGTAGTSAGGTGGAPACDCPATPPATGSACEFCADLPACTYNDCAGAGRTVATCSGDAWEVTTEACVPGDCNGFACGEQVCLAFRGQAAGDQRCADDPCAPSPLTCECAASLCNGEFNATECHITGPNEVQCRATSSGCTPDGICPP